MGRTTSGSKKSVKKATAESGESNSLAQTIDNVVERASSGELRNVSGIGTELGMLQNIKALYDSDGIIADSDVELVELISGRIAEFDESNRG